MQNVHVVLKHNGQPVARVIGDIHHTGFFGRGSLTLLYHLNVVDNIWTSHAAGSQDTIVGDNPAQSVFIGYNHAVKQ